MPCQCNRKVPKTPMYSDISFLYQPIFYSTHCTYVNDRVVYYKICVYFLRRHAQNALQIKVLPQNIYTFIMQSKSNQQQEWWNGYSLILLSSTHGTNGLSVEGGQRLRQWTFPDSYILRCVKDWSWRTTNQIFNPRQKKKKLLKNKYHSYNTF